MLDKFFAVNMPYGMKKNENGEWAIFNREYLPLGNTKATSTESSLLYLKYNSISEKKLFQLAREEIRLTRDDKGKINSVFFYGDENNPALYKVEKQHYWDEYFNKIQLLGKWKLAEN